MTLRIVISVLLIFLIITSCSTVKDNDRQAIINSVFDKMELQGVATQKPLLYGYVFYDNDISKLEELKDILLIDNYNLVKLEKTANQDFILRVEKIEIHSRKSFLERENQLDKLAKKLKVATYDGWDVGNADSTKPLVSNNTADILLDMNSVTELYRMANNLYDSESYDKAIIAFQKCLDINYKSDTCYYKQGISYISVGQTKIGIEKLEEALKINPQYFKACFNIGATCYDNQEYQKSIEFYGKAAKLNASDDRVYYGIAASQFVLGQLNEAAANCETALKINPGNNNAITLLERIKKQK